MNAPYYQSFHHQNDVRAFVTYCFDPDLVVEGVTGGFRALSPDDFGSTLSLTGDLHVGNVGISSGTLDSVGVIDTLTYLAGGLIGVTGTVTIANGVSINLTGSPSVTVQNGISVNVTGSPTVTVPQGLSVNVTGSPSVTVQNGISVNVTGSPTVTVPQGLSVNVTGSPSVTIQNGASVNVTGSPSVTIQNGASVNVTGSPTVTLAPQTSNGLSTYRNIDLGTGGVNIKASAGQVYGWYLFNNSVGIRYVRLYDSSSAPVVGTTTPLMTIPLPASGGANLSLEYGITFTGGIGIGATAAVADNDTTAPSANDVIANILYK